MGLIKYNWLYIIFWQFRRLNFILCVYDAMFMTLGCSVAMEHAVFKIKYKQDCSTKLIEISIVDYIYDFESYHVLNLIL